MTTTQSIITMTKYEIKVKFLGLPLSCSSPTLSCARCYYTTANDEWFEQDVIVRFLGSLFTPPPFEVYLHQQWQKSRRAILIESHSRLRGLPHRSEQKNFVLNDKKKNRMSMAVLPGRHVPAYVRESYPSFFIENKRPNLLFSSFL